MKLRALIGTCCISAAMSVAAVPASAARAARSCVAAAKATPASYTWDFHGEANAIFKDIQSDARLALYQADTLQTYTRQSDVSWRSNTIQLNRMRNEVNDVGAKLCRLETIRSAVTPEQRRMIDQIATAERLLADNVTDAYSFGKAHSQDLWLAPYRLYMNNLYDQASDLTHSVDRAVEISTLSKEYRNLGHRLDEVRAAS